MSTPGIKVRAVTAWMAERADIARPLKFEPIAGGRSNLTFRVTDARGRAWALRRPPLHGVLPSAHDMGREHRILSALARTNVPVPRTLGYCEDADVTGAPFYVMDFVVGQILRSEADANTLLKPESRKAAGEDLVDVLVALHEIEPDEVGLGDLGKREDYVARQLNRWQRQLEASRTRELPVLDEVHRRLVAAIPAQPKTSIVHGDYRLDNVVVSELGIVLAVLDWELCTLGDPLADLGTTCVYWSDPGDDVVPLGSAPTIAQGFPRRAEVAERYAKASGQDLAELDYYLALGYWKLAAILEGVYSRYVSGAYGDTDESWQRFDLAVLELAEAALEATKKARR